MGVEEFDKLYCQNSNHLMGNENSAYTSAVQGRYSKMSFECSPQTLSNTNLSVI